MSQSDESPEQVSDTTSAAGQTDGPAVGGGAGEPVGQETEARDVQDAGDQSAFDQGADHQGAEYLSADAEGAEDLSADAEGADGQGGGSKAKVAAAAAGTGAAVAGIAGGIAVAARDTRRRVLGVPVGKRSRFQKTASSVVDKATEPARRLGSRFSKE
jgi:hypothetical protein